MNYAIDYKTIYNYKANAITNMISLNENARYDNTISISNGNQEISNIVSKLAFEDICSAFITSNNNSSLHYEKVINIVIPFKEIDENNLLLHKAITNAINLCIDENIEKVVLPLESKKFNGYTQKEIEEETIKVIDEIYNANISQYFLKSLIVEPKEEKIEKRNEYTITERSAASFQNGPVMHSFVTMPRKLNNDSYTSDILSVINKINDEKAYEFKKDKYDTFYEFFSEYAKAHDKDLDKILGAIFEVHSNKSQELARFRKKQISDKHNDLESYLYYLITFILGFNYKEIVLFKCLFHYTFQEQQNIDSFFMERFKNRAKYDYSKYGISDLIGTLEGEFLDQYGEDLRPEPTTRNRQPKDIRD